MVSDKLPKSFHVRVGMLAHETIDFLDQPSVDYSNITPQSLPESGGIYAIFVKGTDKALYVNYTSDLRDAIYVHQLMGNGHTSSIKGYLYEDEDLTEIINMTTAKQWLRENCYVKWVVMDDHRKRVLLSRGLRFMLDVQYIPER